MYKIISSGSNGNAVIYLNKIMVDCGVPFKKLTGLYKDLSVVLLTHEHGDHIKQDTLRKLSINHPNLKVVCPEYLLFKVKPVVKRHQIVVAEIGKVYQVGNITFSPVKLYHNVPNVGYRIMMDNIKILHATDTCTLDGIIAKNYNLYGLEFNYDEETIQDVINEKREKGIFVYEEEAILNHLSWQKAQAFYDSQKGSKSQLLKLHISSRYEGIV